MPGRRNPTAAAVLGFIFGPLGYLYLGWRYALLSLAMLLIFAFVLTVVGIWVPPWMKYVVLAVFAWKGYTICSVRNEMMESGDDVSGFDSFPFAAMAMSDLLVGIAMFYGGAIGLYIAVGKLLDGNVLGGLISLVIGTPLLVMIASFVFSFIAMGIDALFVRGMENAFRK